MFSFRRLLPRSAVANAAVVAALAIPVAPETAQGQGSRKEVTMDPATPLADLLPAPARLNVRPALAEQLMLMPGMRAAIFFQVPEVHFQDPSLQESTDDIKIQIARINHVDQGKPGRFLKLLREHRPDLDGLPFQKAEARRLSEQRAREFDRAVRLVRRALANWRPRPEPFHVHFESALAVELGSLSKKERASAEEMTHARIAASMQMLIIEPEPIQVELVDYLAGVKLPEATRALARLAIFPFEEATREAALAALKKRDTGDVTDMLLAGLRYPWPGVGKKAAQVIVDLKRTDLVPRLVDVLDEPDPLSPWLQLDASGRKVLMVRELVRINHHRNCLLCHAPGNPDTSLRGLLAPVPSPRESLPQSVYSPTNPDILIRADVTYLRQDFTLLLPVEKHGNWPEIQRFDFFVRTRQATKEEAKKGTGKRQPGYVAPAHRTVVSALEQLTGRTGGPSAAVWRRELGLPR
jgi:hypothetical protein